MHRRHGTRPPNDLHISISSLARTATRGHRHPHCLIIHIAPIGCKCSNKRNQKLLIDTPDLAKMQPLARQNNSGALRNGKRIATLQPNHVRKSFGRPEFREARARLWSRSDVRAIISRGGPRHLRLTRIDA